MCQAYSTSDVIYGPGGNRASRKPAELRSFRKELLIGDSQAPSSLPPSLPPAEGLICS